MKNRFEECSFCDTLLDNRQVCATCHTSYNGIELREEDNGDW